MAVCHRMNMKMSGKNLFDLSYENSFKQDQDSCHYSNPIDDNIERTDFYHSVGKFSNDFGA